MKHAHELRALTGMRGIAAWFVVLYHIRLSIAGLPPFWVGVFAKGYLAVDFFFLLSGFVIWLSWNERLRDGEPAMVRLFLWKRLARIWPLHLVMLGCAAALAVLLAVTGRDHAHYPFAALPLHVALLQNWGFTDRLMWNDPSWSISTELAAYVAFAVLGRKLRWQDVPSWQVLLAIATLIATLYAIMRHGGAADMLGNDIAHFGLIRCLIEFAAGTAVAALWLRWRGSRQMLLRSAFATLVVIALWCAGGAEALMAPLTFAALLLLLALSAGAPGNILESRPIHYLGEISYATYLGHFLLFVLFKMAFVDDPDEIPMMLAALYLTLVLGTSVALHHLIELPAQDWMNRLPARWRGAGATVQASANSS